MRTCEIDKTIAFEARNGCISTRNFLTEEMASLDGFIKKAQNSLPHLYGGMKQLRPLLAKKNRKTLANDTREVARKEYFYAPVHTPGVFLPHRWQDQFIDGNAQLRQES